jgi:hypothetical protein
MNDNYADPVDRAVVEQDRLLEDQLRRAREKPVERLAYIGRCWNCSEPLAEPLRFCDADCRDDYEKIKRSRAQKVY